MKAIRRLMLAAVAVGAMAIGSAASAAPSIWVVKDHDSTVYLFGTIHVLPEGVEWRTPLYDKAYAEAAEVWQETPGDAGDDEALVDLMARTGLDPKAGLEKSIGRKRFRALVRLVEPHGFSRDDVRQMQPWLAYILLEGVSARDEGLESAHGAEDTSEASAPEDGKALRYFETAEDQLNAFSTLSLETQVTLLNESLDAFEAAEKALRAEQRATASRGKSPNTREAETGVPDELTLAWLEGDEAALAEGLTDYLREEQPPVYESVILRRNLAWTEILDKELKGSGTDLVIVGAGHIVGEEGLPALLRARGYTVERIQ